MSHLSRAYTGSYGEGGVVIVFACSIRLVSSEMMMRRNRGAGGLCARARLGAVRKVVKVPPPVQHSASKELVDCNKWGPVHKDFGGRGREMKVMLPGGTPPHQDGPPKSLAQAN